jgi:hypothetical protein
LIDQLVYKLIIFFIFCSVVGGRFRDERLNDMYCVDLQRKGHAVWYVIQPHDALAANRPLGRSWHSFTHIGDGNALLYGGFDKLRIPLNDAWLWLSDCQKWVEFAHLRRDRRLWHTAHYIVSLSSVCLIGGVKESLFSENLHECWHPRKIDHLVISPPSLFALTLDTVVANYNEFKEQVPYLPSPLPRHIKYKYDASLQAL